MEQIIIGICGLSSVWLSQDKDEQRRRYACLFGLFAQPFWLYTSYTHEQWGIVFLTFLYAYGWFRGLKTYWLTKE